MRDIHEVRTARATQYKHGFWTYKVQVHELYTSRKCQLGVAGLILTNFCVECIQRQVDPGDPGTRKHEEVWKWFEDFFCVAFLFELLINMYGSWRAPFFRQSWNYFDMFVVFIGILILVRCPMPGPLGLVLMLRSFRVFRLFGKVESMKKILRSIFLSIPGMFNAFMILLLVVCIYAVLAVDLYSDYYVMVNPDPSAPETTSRGDRYAEEYYGTFFKALYTLFQILTGESWSEMGVRPIFAASQSVWENIGSSLFFISFVIINGVVLLNVVVAVLLDGMASASAMQEDDLVEMTDPNAPEVSCEEDQNSQDGEAKKECEGDPIEYDGEDDDEAIRKDMAILKNQVDTMSAELKEVLSGLRSLEEQQRFSKERSQDCVTVRNSEVVHDML